MIETEDRDGIAVMRLAHGKANALDLELCTEIDQRLAAHAASDSRALVLTGRGRIFCAGVDLRRLLDGGTTYIGAFLPRLGRAFEAVFEHPKPVVAAINGHAVAGGCVLACAADRRLIANGDARVGVPELRVGVPFPSIALEILRHAVEPGWLERIVTGGDTWPPAEALARGLVDEVVEEAGLVDDAVATASDLASRGAALFTLTKRQLRGAIATRIRAEAARNEAEVSRAWKSPETIETIRAYVERTLGGRG